MGKFNGMLLISDYDNTFQYTESALSGGGAEAVPPPPARNLAAAERWMSATCSAAAWRTRQKIWYSRAVS